MFFQENSHPFILHATYDYFLEHFKRANFTYGVFVSLLMRGLTFRAASSPPCISCCCTSSWRSCSPSWPAPSPSCKQIRRRGTSRCTLGPAAPHRRYLLGMIQCCRILKSLFLQCILCLHSRLVEFWFWSRSECHHHKSQSMF